jgi:hypothetical protein
MKSRYKDDLLGQARIRPKSSKGKAKYQPPDLLTAIVKPWKCVINGKEKNEILHDDYLRQYAHCRADEYLRKSSPSRADKNSIHNEADAVGIRVSVDGDDLVLQGSAPPSSRLLGLLKHYKDVILALVQNYNSAHHWQDFFDERAGIHNEESSRGEAEVLAYNECVDHWIDEETVSSSDGRCVHCGVGEQPNDALRAHSGAALLHDRCHPAWLHARKAEAAAALSANGIRPPWHESAEGWYKFFDERAAFREFNYGRSQYEARAEAYKDCIDAWVDLKLVWSSGNLCSRCGTGKQPDDGLRPYGHIIGEFAIAWLHERCWPAWIEARQAEAMAALAAMGIQPPTDSEPKSE